MGGSPPDSLVLALVRQHEQSRAFRLRMEGPSASSLSVNSAGRRSPDWVMDTRMTVTERSRAVNATSRPT